MLSWFDVAYAVLNVFMVLYFFKRYFSFRKRTALLVASGFTCLLISDFVWVFALIPLLSDVLILLSYLRLGLYTAFILLILRALQPLDPNTAQED